MGSPSFRLRQPGARSCKILSESHNSRDIFVHHRVGLRRPNLFHPLIFRAGTGRGPQTIAGTKVALTAAGP